MISRRRLSALIGAGLSLAACLTVTPVAAQNRDPVVFAAASLKEALDAVAAAHKAAGGTGARISYAASSALAKQIEAAAPADLFVSADLEWMDYLEQRKLIQTHTRVALLGNRLVLIGPANATTRLEPVSNFALAAALGKDGRLALGDTRAVPAGKYAKAALEKLGVWASVASRTAEVESVRAALALVSRGEAPLGIVYATDAAADKNVRVVCIFPEDSHPRILYPAALTANASSPGVTGLLNFMKSAAARPIWERYGFTVVAD